MNRNATVLWTAIKLEALHLCMALSGLLVIMAAAKMLGWPLHRYDQQILVASTGIALLGAVLCLADHRLPWVYRAAARLAAPGTVKLGTMLLAVRVPALCAVMALALANLQAWAVPVRLNPGMAMGLGLCAFVALVAAAQNTRVTLKIA